MHGGGRWPEARGGVGEGLRLGFGAEQIAVELEGDGVEVKYEL